MFSNALRAPLIKCLMINVRKTVQIPPIIAQHHLYFHMFDDEGFISILKIWV